MNRRRIPTTIAIALGLGACGPGSGGGPQTSSGSRGSSTAASTTSGGDATSSGGSAGTTAGTTLWTTTDSGEDELDSNACLFIPTPDLGMSSTGIETESSSGTGGTTTGTGPGGSTSTARSAARETIIERLIVDGVLALDVARRLRARPEPRRG